MLNPEEADTCVPDSQETYYEGSNESAKKEVISETQSASLNESQNFCLVLGDESVQDGEANQQGSSIEQSDPQQISDAAQSETNNKVTIPNDKETKNDDDKSTENEAIKKPEETISDDVQDSEKKDDISDEDEVIQATPPHCLPKAASNIDVASLKRKADAIEEPLAKVPKILSQEDAMEAKQRQEEKERRQSCESNDSYEDLFKDIDKNVIIEETQDSNNQEFTKGQPEERAAATATSDPEIQERSFEQIEQRRDELFPSEKCCEKDENLNVSAKLSADTSANDCLVVNNSQAEDHGPPLEDNVIVTEVANERAETSGKTNESVATKEAEAAPDVSEETQQADQVERAEKITADEEKKQAPSGRDRVASEAAPIASKPRTSVELIYDGARPSAEAEVVDLDDEVKIVLDSSAEAEVVEIVDESPERVVAGGPSCGRIADGSRSGSGSRVHDSLEKGAEVNVMSMTTVNTSDFGSRSTVESMKETSLESRPNSQPMVNGGGGGSHNPSVESKRNDTDATLSVESVDTFPDIGGSSGGGAKGDVGSFAFKDNQDNIELISISDNETSNVEEKTRATQVLEREVNLYVKLKCLVHVDESTKEYVGKELAAVQCELAAGRQKNAEDSQSSLADISDNKESSPGSVNSNPQLFPLHPCRLSIMSSVSSSSASSAASLAARVVLKGAQFPMPHGPAKHARKLAQDMALPRDRQALEESHNRVIREWRNHQLLTATVLSCANAELSTAACATMETYASNERLDDPHHLQKSSMRSSTPEAAATTRSPEPALTVTPKSTKKSKALKRPRSKVARSTAAAAAQQTNGEGAKKVTAATVSDVGTPTRKKIKTESVDSKPLIGGSDAQANSTPGNAPDGDSLVGKAAFAKWSDNNYYPGTVVDRIKAKYKVNFYDGKSKTLIPEFVIALPKTLREGLSVYATTRDGYSYCGIIVDVQMASEGGKDGDQDGDHVYYTVETDEGERLRVQLRDISLSSDQALVLKEEIDAEGKGSSVPSTPKALDQVTLDNMVDGKRRSKRIGSTPGFSTPKSRGNVATSGSAVKIEPSVSGVSAKKERKNALPENDGVSSDSNVDTLEEYDLMGIQKEINGTPYEQIVKGPQNRIKGKSRSRKVDDAQIIADLGPIPTDNTIFKGMSFILTCASKESLDRYKNIPLKKPAASGTETENTETELETENEDEWEDRSFVRERLQAQILAGGGKLYKEFDQIPPDEYKCTKLITNVPNTTATSLLCLSVGIPACNHKWIIRCCSEGKAVNAAEEALPTGWSIQRKTYVEAFQASGSKPLSEKCIIIPAFSPPIFLKKFAPFWRHVCENAGAVVLIAENSGSMESLDFDSDKMVVSNRLCPSWVVDRASQLKIPVLSTTWVTQCLIEGKLCPYGQHSRYKYNFSELK